MICNKCGAELNPEDKFCTSCGTPVNPLPDEVKYGPKAENADVPQQATATPEPQPPVEDPYSSLDPATNPVNTQNTGSQSTPNNDSLTSSGISSILMLLTHAFARIRILLPLIFILNNKLRISSSVP